MTNTFIQVDILVESIMYIILICIYIANMYNLFYLVNYIDSICQHAALSVVIKHNMKSKL